MKKILILGAAGRDFHNFNVVFRNNPEYDVVAFTATQIPDIAGRRYPRELGRKLLSERHSNLRREADGSPDPRKRNRRCCVFLQRYIASESYAPGLTRRGGGLRLLAAGNRAHAVEVFGPGRLGVRCADGMRQESGFTPRRRGIAPPGSNARCRFDTRCRMEILQRKPFSDLPRWRTSTCNNARSKNAKSMNHTFAKEQWCMRAWTTKRSSARPRRKQT